jgi:hypothetical protein
MQINHPRKKKHDSCTPENCEIGLNLSCKALRGETLTDEEAINTSDKLRVTG